jgi:hypothetical protein
LDQTRQHNQTLQARDDLPPYLAHNLSSHIAAMSKATKPEPGTAGFSKGDVMTYDPEQDPEERRGLRKDYRALQTRFDGMLCLHKVIRCLSEP